MTTVNEPRTTIQLKAVSDIGVTFNGLPPGLPFIIDGGDAFVSLFTIVDAGNATDVHLPANTADGGFA